MRRLRITTESLIRREQIDKHGVFDAAGSDDAGSEGTNVIKMGSDGTEQQGSPAQRCGEEWLTDLETSAKHCSEAYVYINVESNG